MLRESVRRTAFLTWRVYGFAIVMAVIAIIPGCNILYSGHGGIAWLVAPLAFPFALMQLIRLGRKASPYSRSTMLRFAAISLALYIPLAYVAAAAGAHSIRSFFGLEVDALTLWGIFLFPFGLLFTWS